VESKETLAFVTEVELSVLTAALTVPMIVETLAMVRGATSP
jgi:hypothetical protein